MWVAGPSSSTKSMQNGKAVNGECGSGDNLSREPPKADWRGKSPRDPSTPRPSVNQPIGLLRRFAQEGSGRGSLQSRSRAGRGSQIFLLWRREVVVDYIRILFVAGLLLFWEEKTRVFAGEGASTPIKPEPGLIGA